MKVLILHNALFTVDDLLREFRKMEPQISLAFTDDIHETADIIRYGYPAAAVLINASYPDERLVDMATALRRASEHRRIRVGAVVSRPSAETLGVLRKHSIAPVSLEASLANIVSKLDPRRRLDEENDRMEVAEAPLPKLASERLLTPRQVAVLKLVYAGKSNKEIASSLEMTEGTVKAHCKNIFRALGVTNRTQAAILVHKAGYGDGLDIV